LRTSVRRWYGVDERPTRTLRYASAGSPPAYAFTAEDRSTTSALHTRALPVGAFEETPFTLASYAVPPGCRILVYSDGASEVLLADGDQLSQEDFRTLVTRLAEAPGWTLDDLIDRLRGLTANGVFEDDLSLIQLAFD
jgi:sigma-B regulation protein RsbU (phosphoserine phosphatase)